MMEALTYEPYKYLRSMNPKGLPCMHNNLTDTRYSDGIDGIACLHIENRFSTYIYQRAL